MPTIVWIWNEKQDWAQEGLVETIKSTKKKAEFVEMMLPVPSVPHTLEVVVGQYEAL